nr:aa3-type cytochrome c oxidase subunit IV [uncultured Cohaesibacter sp.]
MDYPEHYHTYDLFTGLVKYGSIASIVIVALMAIFLL